jgi:tRNA splicing ligase
VLGYSTIGYSVVSIKRTGCNKRTGGKILSKLLIEQEVINNKWTGRGKFSQNIKQTGGIK